jgi:predicted dehydrogenase
MACIKSGASHPGIVSHRALRFAIVSPGRWGRKLLDAARGSAKLEFAGVTNRDPVRAAEIVRDYGGRDFGSFERLLADHSVEAVVLPTPHFLHHPQAMAALRAGKHVFVEKPITTTPELAGEIAALAAERRLTVAVGHQARFTGMARVVKEKLAAGEFGAVPLIVIVQGFPKFLDTAPQWRDAVENIPGGPLDEFGVHYFDLLHYWFGPVKRVTGFVRSALARGTVPDVAVVGLEFAGGLLATYATHFVSVGLSRMTLYGTRGAMEINRFGEWPCTWQPVTDLATARAGGAPAEAVTFPGPALLSSALTAELEAFADSVREGTPPPVGARESIAALRICRAAMEAQATGRTVEL